MDYRTGLAGSSAPNLSGLIQSSYSPVPGQAAAGAPVQTTSVSIPQQAPVQQAPMNPMQAFFASLPQPVMQQAYQPQPMAQPVYQPSSLTQQIARNLNQPITNTGEWMAANERAWQLEQERRAMNANLAPALNQSFYDATRAEANRRLQGVDPNSMSAQIYSAVANNGSQMMVPGASFQLPSGDQALSYLDQIARQGGQVSPALRQMAADSDYLARTVGRDGLYQSGSLSNWMSNPIGYKSMGIEGRTPFKTYQDIDSPESLAYGGDGSQMAQQLSMEALRDFRWNQDAINAYNKSMANNNPAGRFIGGGPNVVNTGVTGKVVGWNPSQSSGPARNTGYGRNGGVSGFPDADWIDTPGDSWRWDKGEGMWTQDGIPEPVDPVNSQWVNDLNYKGRSEAERNQQLGGMGVLAPMAGYATAPKIYSRPASQSVPTVKNVANSSGGFGGKLSPGWLDVDMSYGPLFVKNYKPREIRPADKLDNSGFLQGILDARLMGIR